MERDTEAGEYLYHAGGELTPFFVVLDGSVEILREGDDRSSEVLVVHTRRRFLGELNMLTGQSRTSRRGSPNPAGCSRCNPTSSAG